MSDIGLFTNASSATIPATAQRVYTSGYSTVGIGAAFYNEAAEVTFERVGVITGGSAVITGLRTTDDLTVGANVSHARFASGTTISSIDSQTQVTVSNNATGSGTLTGANLFFTTPVNAAYVGENSRTAFISSDERGFVLCKGQTVTPLMLGATDDPTLAADGTEPIQAFWDWCIEQQPILVDCTLNSGISDTIYIGPNLTPDGTVPRTIIGDMRLRMIAGSEAVIECCVVRNLGHAQWHGKLRVTGQGSTSFSGRLNAVAIAVESCERLVVTGGMRGDNAWWGGIVFAVASNNQCSVEQLWTFNCGSGHSQTASHSLGGAWSNPVNSGSASSTTQRTTLSLDTMMPYDEDVTIRNYMKVTETPTHLRIGATLYRVTSVDTGAGTVQIFPWIDSTLGSSGSYTWVFGGGMVTRSGDGLVTVNNHTATRCGRGACIASQYAAHYHGLVATTCGTALFIGREQGASTIAGAHVTGLYFEGTSNIEQVVLDAPTNASYGYIHAEHNLDLAKCFVLGGARDASNVILAGEVGREAGSGAWTMSSQGRYLQFERSNLISGDGSTRTFREHGRGPHRVTTLRRDSQTVTLSVQGSGEMNRLFGYRGATYLYVGTGANGAPTGTIAFNPPSGGTINGGAADAGVSFAGFSGPAGFEIYHSDAAQLTWTVRPTVGWSLRGSATYDPPSLAAGASASTTVSVTGAALGDTFVPSFSLNLQGIVLTAYVSAADTVTALFFNPTGGAIDLGSGTLAVRRLN